MICWICGAPLEKEAAHEDHELGCGYDPDLAPCTCTPRVACAACCTYCDRIEWMDDAAWLVNRMTMETPEASGLIALAGWVLRTAGARSARTTRVVWTRIAKQAGILEAVEAALHLELDASLDTVNWQVYREHLFEMAHELDIGGDLFAEARPERPAADPWFM